MRTYRVTGSEFDCSVFDAVLVALAHPQWFPPVAIGTAHSKELLVNGDVGFNNPTKAALEEAERAFGSGQGVSIVISFGSGQRGVHVVAKSGIEELQEAMLAMTMEGGGVADELAQRFPNSSFYYRFSVSPEFGLGDIIDWDDSKITGITGHTKTYTDRNSQMLATVARILMDNKASHTISQLSESNRRALAPLSYLPQYNWRLQPRWPSRYLVSLRTTSPVGTFTILWNDV